MYEVAIALFSAAIVAVAIASAKPSITTAALAFIIVTATLYGLAHASTPLPIGYNSTLDSSTNTTMVTYFYSTENPPLPFIWAVWGMWFYGLVLLFAVTISSLWGMRY